MLALTNPSTTLKDYLALCKPKVVLLMLLTAAVGMCLSVHSRLPWDKCFFGMLGIALCAGSAAAINHLIDRHIDALMARTHRRPVAQGRICPRDALRFAGILGITGTLILYWWVNALTAWLTTLSLVGYAVVYTGFLKRATPQNIVIGGLAGAAPPLLGWTAITGDIGAEPLLLVLIIFAWTPPHFWALAIYRLEDYRAAGIPMLPVTHGIAMTKWHIFLYTLLLCLVTLMPFLLGMSGWIYLLGSQLLGLRFLYWALKLLRSDKPRVAMQTFRYSISYLMMLFVVLLIDHYKYW